MTEQLGQGVGNQVETGTGESPPADPVPPAPVVRPDPAVVRPDELLDALLAKLEKVSPIWTQTFAISPEIDVPAYRRLQKVLNAYGYGPVRHVLEMNLNLGIVPERASAMPMVIAWLKKMEESSAKGDRPSV